MTESSSAGFPHSDICGSSDICSLPQLFAAYHVFLRLLVPRHPPCALSSLTCLSFPAGAGRTSRMHSVACSGLGRQFPVVFMISLSFLVTFVTSDVFSLSFGFFRILWFRYFFVIIRFSRCFLHPSMQVGLSGLEPPTSRLSGVRSNRLSYKPRVN